MTKLKTFNDLAEALEFIKDEGTLKVVRYGPARAEAIKLISNLQGPDTITSLLMAEFPDNLKGSIAVDKWNDSVFTYGAEYGMLAMLLYFFNLTEEDLK